ncbi:hypothetical protein [Deinococcus multiflagellatus]|uniref:Uncharacterized protein n=1 Tax=Deinococcus multiflagellatus TaxID=1656887 RepID=A0ABW1ZV90_9DEIO
MPLQRESEIFEGTADELAATIAVGRKSPDALPTNAILVANAGRREMLRATIDTTGLEDLAALRGAGVKVTLVTGLIEAAAHHNQDSQLILHASDQAPGQVTLAINTPSSVDVATTRLTAGATLEGHALGLIGTVMSSQQLAGDITVLLLGTLAAYRDDIHAVLDDSGADLSINTVALSDEDAARLLITHPKQRPGSLSTLVIPTAEPVTLKHFAAHLASGLLLGGAAATFAVLGGVTRAETRQVEAQTAALEQQAAAAEALRTANDQLAQQLDQARNLTQDRGQLGPDLRRLALTLYDSGATLTKIEGPGAAAPAAPEFDGQALRATYALSANLATPSQTEQLVNTVNSSPLAANVQRVACDKICSIDLTLGFIKEQTP